MSWGVTLRWVVLGGALSGPLAAGAEEPQVGASGAQNAEDVTSPEGMASDETSRAISDSARRAEQLAQREGLGPDVQGPLSGVKLALEAMRQAWAHGDLAAASRAEGVARAGLALAERRYSLSLERALMRAAIARRDAARTRVQTSAAAREAESKRLEGLAPTTAPEAQGSQP